MHVINELKIERNFFVDIEINNDIPVGKGIPKSTSLHFNKVTFLLIRVYYNLFV